jgi:thiol-disulfide isomerase/thioredoxin
MAQAGIRFEQNLSWPEVVAKAKTEHKFIFVDCYTTWCGPCKDMNKRIFPQAAVGKFYNEHFINVKLQMDTTQKDDQAVRRWHPIAQKFAHDYYIYSYPTYLYFDSNGTVLHRSSGISHNANAFIEKGLEAFRPEKQYFTNRQKYEGGYRTDTFLRNLAQTAYELNDLTFAKYVMRDYLATQETIYTQTTLKLLEETLENSTDTAFTIFLENAHLVDSVLGNGSASSATNYIILREELFQPYFGTALPNWDELAVTLKSKYPTHAHQALLYCKLMYAERKKDWKNYFPLLETYMDLYGKEVALIDLNFFAYAVFENYNTEFFLSKAIRWCKEFITSTNEPAFYDTYANLIYKNGNKQKAIIWETKALVMAKEPDEKKNYRNILNKMKQGEKTW